MKLKIFAAALLLICVACKNNEGQPETDTTVTTSQSVQETGTASATTTGVTGGTSSVLAPDDKEFVSKAGMGGLAEVRTGDLAIQKANNAAVKSFAQRMVTDHSKANAELTQLATAKGVALPAELTGEAKDAYDHLNGLSGAAFDKAYMQHMVEDHEKDVAEFEKASTSAQDTDLKAWATNTLPTLKEHLALAKEVAGKLR